MCGGGDQWGNGVNGGGLVAARCREAGAESAY